MCDWYRQCGQMIPKYPAQMTSVLFGANTMYYVKMAHLIFQLEQMKASGYKCLLLFTAGGQKIYNSIISKTRPLINIIFQYGR